MIYGEDLCGPCDRSPSPWSRLPPEIKVHVLSFLPYGTVQNIARFVSREMNDLVVEHVFFDNVRVEKSGVVTGGLTETEFRAMCREKSTTATSITVFGDTTKRHRWTFQDIDGVLLSTTWRCLTTLVIDGPFRYWNEDVLVGALRGGNLRGLKCLKLVQQNPINCMSLGGWELPDVRTVALNVGVGFREFIRQQPPMRPFDEMTKLDNLQLMNLEASHVYYPELVHPLSSFLDEVLTSSVRFVRVEAYPSCFRFGAIARVFANVETLSVEGHMLKSSSLPPVEPSSLMLRFPNVTKIFVVWDVLDVHLPTPCVGVDFIQNVRGRLGEGWDGRAQMTRTKLGERVKSALFIRG
jgi:hypothetical protein